MNESKTVLPDKFETLRRDLFAYLAKCLAEDGHCKSYEGAFSIQHHLPNYFEETHNGGDAQSLWRIHLDCYLIGPTRHYDWDGDTFDNALEKCERDLREWMKE